MATTAAVVLCVSPAPAFAGSISGTVTDSSNGRPLVGAQACALRTENGPRSCATTGSGGTYEIGNLIPESDYSVFFSAGPNYVSQYWQEESSFADRDTIDITGGDATFVDDSLPEVAPARISGRVSARKTGSPLGEIRVCALGATQTEVVGCAQTASDGSYALSLPFGSYKVSFNEPQLEHFNPLYLSQYWEGQASFTAATTIALPGPEARAGIDAQLQMPGEGTETVASPPPPSAGGSPPAVTAPAGAGKPTASTCRKGFRKKKVKGKVRCVRRQPHHHPRKRHARHA
ncbi:MAG TPA: carboxypeptidase-like regulatory domain-containing protein [Solirubrobacterales bacterium]|nr:carboxypeptidase-like regulatory domain-containing protein [Solirubrobacterales bacterium]